MFTIAISGGTCSGKTTLSRSLALGLENSQLIPLDNYYKKTDLHFEERAKINHDLPQELDWPLLEQHISMLRSGEQILMPVYSFRLHERSADTILVSPPEVLILEGIHCLYSEKINEMLDLSIFLESTLQERFSRRLERDIRERCSDIEYVKNKFHQQTEKIYREIVEQYRNKADLITSDLQKAEDFIVRRLTEARI